MILPDFILHSRANKIWNYSGLDSPKECLDKRHFDNYPYEVIYQYNSRGFRDAEWPGSSELADSIWCVGDSFTEGMGVPYNHAWPAILKSVSKKNTINVSMDGASNDWISRKTQRIIDAVSPKNIVIQWSFFTRSEINDVIMCDEGRRLQFTDNTLSLRHQFNNFKKNFSLVESAKANTNIIHSFIPNAFLPDLKKLWDKLKGSSWPDQPPKNIEELHNSDQGILYELIKFDQFDDFTIHFEFTELLSNVNVVNYTQIDWARDGCHYDIKTAIKLVNEILPLLE